MPCPAGCACTRGAGGSSASPARLRQQQQGSGELSAPFPVSSPRLLWLSPAPQPLPDTARPGLFFSSIGCRSAPRAWGCQHPPSPASSASCPPARPPTDLGDPPGSGLVTPMSPRDLFPLGGGVARGKPPAPHRGWEGGRRCGAPSPTQPTPSLVGFIFLADKDGEGWWWWWG